MSNLEQLWSRRHTEERAVIYICVGLLYWILFGLGGIAGIVYSFLKTRLPKIWQWVFLLIALIWSLFVWQQKWYLPLNRYWFLLSLPLFGLTATIFSGLRWLHHLYLYPITWNAALRRQEQHSRKRIEQRLDNHDKSQAQRDDLLSWGFFVDGDKRELGDKVYLHGDYLWFEENLLDQHLLIIGAPGSGKTEALKHLISEILTKTKRDVFIVDGKGEAQFSQAVQSLFQAKRKVKIPIFKMGTPDRGEPYNGFVGDAQAIKQRLVAMFQVEQQKGDAEFYAYVNRALLNLVCLAPKAVPRSLEDLDQALSIGWLRYAYKDDPPKQKAVERYAQWFDGFRVRADVLIWDFAAYLSATGFTLDDSQGAVFSLRTAAMGDSSRRFFNFLIEDFKDWAGKRQQHSAVLIVDEFGQLNSSEIVALIELARSAQLGIILATQDLSSVSNMQVRERLLSSIQTKILMKTDTPELVGEMAGTRKSAHLTYQTDEVDMTGKGSIRLEDERKVDLNAVRQFPPGRAYLIRSGMGAIIQFPQLK